MTRSCILALGLALAASAASAQDRSPATDFDQYGRLKTPPPEAVITTMPGHMVCRNEPLETFHSGATPLVRRCYLVPNHR